jgi:hypothetical protein
MDNPKLFEHGWDNINDQAGTADTEITLRDLFAGFALAGMIAAHMSPEGLCEAAYSAADKLLKERNRAI